jgi:predicted amidohydrolase YtcJ
MSIRILHNARIYTIDPSEPTASAIALYRDRIISIGNEEKIFSEFKDYGEITNLDGRTIIPGLIDAHIHLNHYALNQARVDCEVPSKMECLDRVAAAADKLTPGEWILGHGWNQNDWIGGFGTAEELDKVAPVNPVHLTSKSLHSSWANSRALEISQININTPEPQNGLIQRDENGHPTGILLEGASELVTTCIPEPQASSLIETFLEAQDNLLQMGITGIHDFDRKTCFTVLQKLHADHKLSLRVVKSIPLDALPQAVDIGLRTGFGDDLLRIGSIKMFADGALGPHTAALMKDYKNEPGNRGMLTMDSEEILKHGLIAAENGLSLAVHAIGDRANHEVLNAFEKIREIDPALRHRIEHVQLLHPEDAHRLYDLNIIASMQPIHATSDMMMADHSWGSRASNAYAWRNQLDHGTVLAFGSDAPVESPNPFWGVHAAVTRRLADGKPGPNGWYPEQRLSVYEAIKSFTVGPSFAGGTENYQGKLSPGFLADLLVLDTDPFTCETDEIRGIRPVATMVGGKWAVSSLW